MKQRFWWRSLIVIALIILGCGTNNEIIDASTPSGSKPEIFYKSYVLPKSIVHTVTIPNNKKLKIALGARFAIATATESELTHLEKFAQKHHAIAVINAGFFDPKNQKTTSYVFSKGKLIEDPRENERLVNNPNLIPQMKQILDRSEFRSYLCGSEYIYDIVLHSESIPNNCQLVDAVGAGPQLLPKITDTEEAFVTYEGKKIIKDALGSSQSNARSAVGITRDRQVIFLMVAQKPKSPSNSGMSFQEMADFFKTLGAEKAINLDGGSSASLYYEGKTFYGKVDKKGNSIERPVKSVLMIKYQENF